MESRPGLLRRPQFFAYWAGGLLSNVGTWLQNVTASVFILQLTHHVLMVGVLNFATFAPVLLLSMVGGILSDRFDRRMVVIVSQGCSLIVAAVITVLNAMGRLDAVTLICLATLLGCSYAIAKPALSAILPALVDRDEIAHATAVNTLQFNIGQVAGSALSALILSVGSYTLAFALNTASFAGPLLAMFALRGVSMAATRGKLKRGSATDSATETGVKSVLRSGAMVPLLAAVALSNASVELLRTTAPELAQRLHGLTSSSAGVLVTSYAAGATVGLVFFGQINRRVPPHRLIVAAFVSQTVGVIGTAFARQLVPAVVFASFIGLGFSLNVPVLSGALQLRSPEEFRGRVMSLFSMAHLGLRPLFSLSAGALASVLDVRVTIAICALLPAAATVIVRKRSDIFADTRSDKMNETRPDHGAERTATI